MTTLLLAVNDSASLPRIVAFAAQGEGVTALWEPLASESKTTASRKGLPGCAVLRSASAARAISLVAAGNSIAALGAIAFSGKAIIVKLAYRHGVDAVTLIMYRMLIALPLGVMAATRPGSLIDHACRVVTTAGVSLPVNPFRCPGAGRVGGFWSSCISDAAFSS